MKPQRLWKNIKAAFWSAFETSREKDRSGTEIHILEFPSLQLFNEYRNDAHLASLCELRKKAISNTEIKISSRIKLYR